MRLSITKINRHECDIVMRLEYKINRYQNNLKVVIIWCVGGFVFLLRLLYTTTYTPYIFP